MVPEESETAPGPPRAPADRVSPETSETGAVPETSSVPPSMSRADWDWTSVTDWVPEGIVTVPSPAGMQATSPDPGSASVLQLAGTVHEPLTAPV